MANDEDAIDLMRRVAQLETRLADAHVTNQKLYRLQQDTPLLRVFVQEVSAFHREALLPLIKLVKDAIPVGSDAARYLERIAARAKHFEAQALVAEARQSAIDEQQRLETKP